MSLIETWITHHKDKGMTMDQMAARLSDKTDMRVHRGRLYQWRNHQNERRLPPAIVNAMLADVLPSLEGAKCRKLFNAIRLPDKRDTRRGDDEQG